MMRYEVREVGGRYYVWDNSLGAVVSRQDSLDKAQLAAGKLNSKPQKDPTPKREWDMVRGSFNLIQSILDEGWEPFAVSEGFIYVRKPHNKNPKVGGLK